MPIHGLIHDGQLRACPSCLLGLMYAFRVNVCSQVNVRYQVLRVLSCWWLYKRPSPSLLFLIFLEFLCQESFLHNQIGFLDAHGDHYTTTIYIHYMFFFLCNSILEKFYYLLFHVESGRFLVLLEFLSCCYWCCCYRKEHKLLLVLLLLLLEGACIVIFLLTNKVVLRIDVLPSSILPSCVLHLVVMCLTSYVVQYANLPFHPPFI